jgi:diamine N-acetyltransferase
MSIRLEKINADNWDECRQLDVEPEQTRFVSSNLLCIAEAQFHPGWGAYAVYFNDQMVGFTMYEDDGDQDQWWISSLMIAAGFQGAGYGKAAIRALLTKMEERGCQEVWVGYANDNVAARALYRGIGFSELGLDDDGDMVARISLVAHGA